MDPGFRKDDGSAEVFVLIASKRMEIGERVMKYIQKTSIAITIAGLLVAVSSLGNEAMARERGRRHQGPPPEAYTACEGKSVGDSAEFKSPRGDTVTGTCVQDGERLVLHPDHHPRGRRSDDTVD